MMPAARLTLVREVFDIFDVPHLLAVLAADAPQLVDEPCEAAHGLLAGMREIRVAVGERHP